MKIVNRLFYNNVSKNGWFTYNKSRGLSLVFGKSNNYELTKTRSLRILTGLSVTKVQAATIFNISMFGFYIGHMKGFGTKTELVNGKWEYQNSEVK